MPVYLYGPFTHLVFLHYNKECGDKRCENHHLDSHTSIRASFSSDHFSLPPNYFYPTIPLFGRRSSRQTVFLLCDKVMGRGMEHQSSTMQQEVMFLLVSHYLHNSHSSSKADTKGCGSVLGFWIVLLNSLFVKWP